MVLACGWSGGGLFLGPLPSAVRPRCLTSQLLNSSLDRAIGVHTPRFFVSYIFGIDVPSFSDSFDKVQLSPRHAEVAAILADEV
eukprot:3408066-Amphidinium_carterae.1